MKHNHKDLLQGHLKLMQAKRINFCILLALFFAKKPQNVCVSERVRAPGLGLQREKNDVGRMTSNITCEV